MTDWSKETPVALFAFNRPQQTRAVFAAIRVAQPQHLLLVMDGPRGDRPAEAELCAEVRNIISAVDWPCQVRTNFSATNLGCKRRVSSAVQWVFEQVPEAIILEDDCLPHPTFFRFCDELIKKYRDDNRVGLISGDNFLEGRARTPYSYYFTRHTHIWGWASWRRAMRNYDVAMPTWPEIKEGGWLHDILGDNPDYVRYWSEYFDQVYNGKIDTWDYQLTYSMWINGLAQRSVGRVHH